MEPHINPSKHPSNKDPEKLRQLIEEMAVTIELLTEDIVLKAAVASVFDAYSVEDTIDELRRFNELLREKHPEAAPPEYPSDQTA